MRDIQSPGRAQVWRRISSDAPINNGHRSTSESTLLLLFSVGTVSRTDTGPPGPAPRVSTELSPSAHLALFTLVSTSDCSSFPHFPQTQKISGARGTAGLCLLASVCPPCSRLALAEQGGSSSLGGRVGPFCWNQLCGGGATACPFLVSLESRWGARCCPRVSRAILRSLAVAGPED